jgi:hypothetical protein
MNPLQRSGHEPWTSSSLCCPGHANLVPMSTARVPPGWHVTNFMCAASPQEDPFRQRRPCGTTALDDAPFAYVLASVHFLDAVHDSHPEAGDLLRRLGRHIPADGRVRVRGGAENEALHPLDRAASGPPGTRVVHLRRRLRRSRSPDRVAAGRRWLDVDFSSSSPAGSLDWRGHATVRAIDVLRRNRAASATGSPVLEPSPAT